MNTTHRPPLRHLRSLLTAVAACALGLTSCATTTESSPAYDEAALERAEWVLVAHSVDSALDWPVAASIPGDLPGVGSPDRRMALDREDSLVPSGPLVAFGD